MLGLLLGCELRRSEVVGLNLDQVQSREGHWVIVNLIGKGGRLRTAGLRLPLLWRNCDAIVARSGQVAGKRAIISRDKVRSQ
jgi:site-specific recombinase XerC